jgi:hypothetical protein
MGGMTRNFYRTGTNLVRILLALGGVYWLKQAMDMEALVPWAIAVMSLVIANRNLREISSCILAAASFYLVAYVSREIGADQIWIGYETGVRYFLGFAIAFTIMYHSMFSFFMPLYAAIVRRINP